MATCVGGLLVCVGITKIIDMIGDANRMIGRPVQPIANDTKCKQITRVFANALLFLGLFALALTAFSLGSTLITVGAQAGFLLGFEQAMAVALPKLLFAVGSLVASEIAKRLSH